MLTRFLIVSTGTQKTLWEIQMPCECTVVRCGVGQREEGGSGNAEMGPGLSDYRRWEVETVENRRWEIEKVRWWERLG